MQRAIRRNGIPDEIRGKVWMRLVDKRIGEKYDVSWDVNIC